MCCRPRGIHQGSHSFDRTFEPAEDRFSDEKMSDIELDDGRNACDRGDRVERQPVAGMTFDPKHVGMGRGPLYPLELLFADIADSFAECSRMKFYHRRAKRFSRIDLP